MKDILYLISRIIMLKFNVNNYSQIKQVFNKIVIECNNIKISFKENKDELAILLSIIKDERKMDYYYMYEDTQVHRYINDSDGRVLSINPEKLFRHILWDIDDFIKGKEVP